VSRLRRPAATSGYGGRVVAAVVRDTVRVMQSRSERSPAAGLSPPAGFADGANVEVRAS
jgi:imidazoleglycerol phosphate synthase glutamine amidotransferase subunit HisH